MDAINQKSSPVVCKLTDKEFKIRIEFLRATIFSQVKMIKELTDGYEYVFEQPQEFSLQLAELIVYERQCCPFFHFFLNFEPENGPVKLQIVGSKEIKQMLFTLISESDLKQKLKD